MESINVPIKFTEPVDLGPNKIKWQRKFLDSPVTTSTNDIGVLRFNNLTITQTYRVTYTVRANLAADDNIGLRIIHDGSIIGSNWIGKSAAVQTSGTSFSVIFVASASTVEFGVESVNVGTDLSITGNGTYTEIEELPNHTPGSF